MDRFMFASAVAWAQARTKNADVRLGMLEAYALQRHPELLDGLGPDGEALARRIGSGSKRAESGFTVLVGLGAVILALAPIAGMAVNADAPWNRPNVERIDAATAIPLASVFFWITVAILLVLAGWWIRHGAKWAPFICGYAVISAIMAALALANMTNAAADDGYALSLAELLPAQVTLGAGLLLALAVVIRIKHKDPDALVPVGPSTDQHAASLRAIAALPADERGRLTKDRDDALAVLLASGHIDEARYRAALATPLGALSTLDRAID